MNKLLLSGVAAAMFIAGASQADAEHLSPAQALVRLESNTAAGRFTKAVKRDALSLAFTQDGSSSALYVFTDKDNGFYLAPADDCAPALLGFGDDFDADNIPENMKWWLEQYAEQVSYMAKNNIKAAPLATDNAPVSYLVQTKWNQGDPYNRQCPMLNGSRSVTGCVATATAQVVNYHEWPASNGIGSHSYTWNNQTLTFNYASTSFDWANMLDTYSSSSSTRACNAVASLMSACGIGVNMSYSPSSSGANSFRISSLLVNNLGYDKGVAYMQRDYFSAEEWDAMIYGELAAGRPVIYAGQSNSGGHCFVCDGYQGNGYYHINWGWGGTSDGYFLLSALTPSTQGIGGSNSGYNTDQDAIIGIQQPVEGSVQFLPLYANGGFEYSTTYSGFWFGNQNGYFNYSANANTFTPGIRLEAENGSSIYVASTEVTLGGAYADGSVPGNSIIRVSIPATTPAGTYKAYPVAKVEGGDWQRIFVPYTDNQYVTVRVGNNGAVTYDGSDPDAITSTVTISSITQDADWVSGETVAAICPFVNSSASTETVKLTISFDNVATGKNYSVGVWTIDLPASSTVRYHLQFTCTLPDGKYTARALRDGTTPISPLSTIYVGIRPTEVEVDEIHIGVKEGEDHTLTATVLPEDAFDRTVTWESADPAVATVNEQGTVHGVSVGSTTVTATTINGLKSEVQVTVSDSSGVEDVTVDSETAVDVYTIQGILIRSGVDPKDATEGLPAGLYIVGGRKTIVR